MKLKCVRTDNYGEYRGLFKKYYKWHGIKFEKIIPKIPQHNGVAERINYTINGIIMCMLSHAKLSKAFWGEALKHVVDLVNISPFVPLYGDVTNIIWTWENVSYIYLRVFECGDFV